VVCGVVGDVGEDGVCECGLSSWHLHTEPSQTSKPLHTESPHSQTPSSLTPLTTPTKIH